MEKFKSRKFIYLKVSLVAFIILSISGCATYKYEKMPDTYKGYAIKRNDFLIPEYTIDNKNIAPQDLSVAEQRFKRRHRMVDHYYKKMGHIENQFKVLVLDYPIALVSLMSAGLRLPFVVVSDYRYEHNPKYREIIDKRNDALDIREDEIKRKLQDSLNKFIESDLNKELTLEKSTNPK